MKRVWKRVTYGGVLSACGVLLVVLSVAVVHLIQFYPFGAGMRRAIDLTVLVNTYDESGWPIGNGTGVILDSDDVATAWHVIDDAAYVTITTQDGVSRNVVGICDTSLVHDLAILYAPWLGDEQPEFSSPSPRMSVFSLGYSTYASHGQPDVAHGTLSDDDRVGFVLHDSQIANGFSGGGVWDTDGRLVGINIASRGAGEAQSTAIQAAVVRERHRGAGEYLVYEYPPETDWPKLWWKDGGYQAVRHDAVAMAADSVIARLSMNRNVDSLLVRVRQDFAHPDPHIALLLHGLSRSDPSLVGREMGILDSLDVAWDAPERGIAVALWLVMKQRHSDAIDRLIAVDAEGSGFSDIHAFTLGFAALKAGETGRAARAYERLTAMESPFGELLLKEIYPELAALEIRDADGVGVEAQGDREN